eukprot:6810747-Alexandrium_andersonii.AAC.1
MVKQRSDIDTGRYSGKIWAGSGAERLATVLAHVRRVCRNDARMQQMLGKMTAQAFDSLRTLVLNKVKLAGAAEAEAGVEEAEEEPKSVVGISAQALQMAMQISGVAGASGASSSMGPPTGELVASGAQAAPKNERDEDDEVDEDPEDEADAETKYYPEDLEGGEGSPSAAEKGAAVAAKRP